MASFCRVRVVIICAEIVCKDLTVKSVLARIFVHHFLSHVVRMNAEVNAELAKLEKNAKIIQIVSTTFV